MKKILAFVATAILLSAIAVAQEDVYWVTYYSNRNNAVGADAFVRIVNPGLQGSPLSENQGTVCADIYVFDDEQEMVECCACPITANALLEFSLDTNLVQNPLTGIPPPNSGVIKLVSDLGSNCNPQAPILTQDVRAWATHLQQPVADGYISTEDKFLRAPLSASEQAFLGETCAFVIYLGNGFKGQCTCPF